MKSPKASEAMEMGENRAWGRARGVDWGRSRRVSSQGRGDIGAIPPPAHARIGHLRRQLRFSKTRNKGPSSGYSGSGGKGRGGASGAGPPLVGRLGRPESSERPGEAVP